MLKLQKEKNTEWLAKQQNDQFYPEITGLVFVGHQLLFTHAL
jgi:hypothetical protein